MVRAVNGGPLEPSKDNTPLIQQDGYWRKAARRFRRPPHDDPLTRGVWLDPQILDGKPTPSDLLQEAWELLLAGPQIDALSPFTRSFFLGDERHGQAGNRKLLTKLLALTAGRTTARASGVGLTSHGLHHYLSAWLDGDAPSLTLRTAAVLEYAIAIGFAEGAVRFLTMISQISEAKLAAATDADVTKQIFDDLFEQFPGKELSEEQEEELLQGLGRLADDLYATFDWSRWSQVGTGGVFGGLFTTAPPGVALAVAASLLPQLASIERLVKKDKKRVRDAVEKWRKRDGEFSSDVKEYGTRKPRATAISRDIDNLVKEVLLASSDRKRSSWLRLKLAEIKVNGKIALSAGVTPTAVALFASAFKMSRTGVVASAAGASALGFTSGFRAESRAAFERVMKTLAALEDLHKRTIPPPGMHYVDFPERKDGKFILRAIGAQAFHGGNPGPAFSLELCSGKVVAISGGNGGGKSQRVKLLAALERLAGGKIELNGIDFDRVDPRKARKRIVYFPSGGNSLWPIQLMAFRRAGLTDKEICDALQDSKCTNLQKDVSERLMRAHVRLDDTDLKSVDISTGQDQTLGSRLLKYVVEQNMLDADLFIVDEPYSAQSPANQKLGGRVFRELADMGKAVLVVTHENLTIPDCDEYHIIDPHGKELAAGTPREVFDPNGKHNATTPEEIKYLRQYRSLVPDEIKRELGLFGRRAPAVLTLPQPGSRRSSFSLARPGEATLVMGAPAERRRFFEGLMPVTSGGEAKQNGHQVLQWSDIDRTRTLLVDFGDLESVQRYFSQRRLDSPEAFEHILDVIRMSDDQLPSNREAMLNGGRKSFGQAALRLVGSLRNLAEDVRPPLVVVNEAEQSRFRSLPIPPEGTTLFVGSNRTQYSRMASTLAVVGADAHIAAAGEPDKMWSGEPDYLRDERTFEQWHEAVMQASVDGGLDLHVDM